MVTIYGSQLSHNQYHLIEHSGGMRIGRSYQALQRALSMRAINKKIFNFALLDNKLPMFVDRKQIILRVDIIPE